MQISIRHSNKLCTKNTVVLLYMEGGCAWWVGAWLGGVMYVRLLSCRSSAVRGGYGWIVGDFVLRAPLVLQRT